MKKFVFSLLFVFAIGMSSFASFTISIDPVNTENIEVVDQQQEKCKKGCTCEKCTAEAKKKDCKAKTKCCSSATKECAKKSCCTAKAKCSSKKGVTQKASKDKKCEANCTKSCCKKK